MRPLLARRLHARRQTQYRAAFVIFRGEMLDASGNHCRRRAGQTRICHGRHRRRASRSVNSKRRRIRARSCSADSARTPAITSRSCSRTIRASCRSAGRRNAPACTTRRSAGACSSRKSSTSSTTAKRACSSRRASAATVAHALTAGFRTLNTATWSTRSIPGFESWEARDRRDADDADRRSDRRTSDAVLVRNDGLSERYQTAALRSSRSENATRCR